MIKNVFFLAFICVLVSCQKDTFQLNSKDQLNSKELVTSYKLSGPSDQRDLPSEVRDIIANGGAGHFGCEITNNRESSEVEFGGGVIVEEGSILGTSAYPYTLDMRPIKLFNSSLPCQPGIPYFIFGYIDDGDIFSDDYSIDFRLVLNPNYFDNVKVVDINWELNGQSDSLPLGSFTIDDLQIGEFKSVTCRVFSTDDNVTVYSQEMELDFEISLNLDGGDPIIEYFSEYTFACPSGGTFPIIAP